MSNMELTLQQELEIYEEALRRYALLVKEAGDDTINSFDKLLEVWDAVEKESIGDTRNISVYLCKSLRRVATSVLDDGYFRPITQWTVFWSLRPAHIVEEYQSWFGTYTSPKGHDFKSRIEVLKECVRIAKEKLQNESI